VLVPDEELLVDEEAGSLVVEEVPFVVNSYSTVVESILNNVEELSIVVELDEVVSFSYPVKPKFASGVAN